MLGKTHITFGILFALPLYISFGGGNLIFLMSAAFGSLLPDIDHPRSFISTLHPSTQFFSRHISKIVTHRGIFHTLIAAVVTFILVILLTLYFHASLLYPFFFFIGYISHLASDSLNPTGIRWLGPFRERKISWKIRTGSQSENVVFVLILFFLVFIWLWQIGMFEPYETILPT